MPRPYLGVKLYPIRIHPVTIARIKEIARLRSKGGKKITHGQAVRDVIEIGIERIESCLRP
jgi:hypothetical protein